MVGCVSGCVCVDVLLVLCCVDDVIGCVCGVDCFECDVVCVGDEKDENGCDVGCVWCV